MSCKTVARLNLWHRLLIAIGILVPINQVSGKRRAAGGICQTCSKWCIERGCTGTCYCNIYTGSCLCA